jgi:hypothetical protein
MKQDLFVGQRMTSTAALKEGMTGINVVNRSVGTSRRKMIHHNAGSTEDKVL